jgi:ribosomal protein L37AE/L43A
MSEEEAFGTFWWYETLEEEERERQKRCPKCDSQRIRYDEDHGFWVCLDCGHKWENNKS